MSNPSDSSAPTNDVQLVTSNKANPPATSAYRATVAWVILIVVLTLLAQLQAGRIVIYYVLLLLILFILVTQYQAIAGLLAPVSGGKQ
jgi:hypothetical protein